MIYGSRFLPLAFANASRGRSWISIEKTFLWRHFRVFYRFNKVCCSSLFKYLSSLFIPSAFFICSNHTITVLWIYGRAMHVIKNAGIPDESVEKRKLKVISRCPELVLLDFSLCFVPHSGILQPSDFSTDSLALVSSSKNGNHDAFRQNFILLPFFYDNIRNPQITHQNN